MSRLAAVALLAFLVVSIGAAEETAPPRPEATIEQFLIELNAVERTCGDSSGVACYQAKPVCAQFEGYLKGFRKSLRKACPGGVNGKNVLLEQRKSPDGSLFAAKLLLQSHLLVDLFYEPPSGRLLVVQPPSCLELPEGRVPQFLEQRPETDPPREIVRKVQPEFPKLARQQAVGGMVVLDYVIETDGSVGQVCVVHVAPEGLTLELEAQVALKRWRYAPAPEDADPAGQETRMVTTFWLQ